MTADTLKILDQNYYLQRKLSSGKRLERVVYVKEQITQRPSPPKLRQYPKFHIPLPTWALAVIGFFCLIAGSMAGYVYYFEYTYKNRVYPNVWLADKPVGGQTRDQITNYWTKESDPFKNKQFELIFEDKIATISGAQLDLGFDAELSAVQALSVGRSGHLLADLWTRHFTQKVKLTPYFRWKTSVLDDTLNMLSDLINVRPTDALFNFENGKVTAFKLSEDGRKLDKDKAVKAFTDLIKTAPNANEAILRMYLPVEIVRPSVTTDQVNTFGIKQKLGTGYSVFAGSIPSRIHNIKRASSMFHGHLVKPGEIFSYNDVIGDISASTGYQQAYIIKNGRTVLGDGGGVCQVSSTLFRAALNSGLPILQRHAHAYRVHYYEDGGFKPGLDATVYAPSVDFRFRNDTPASILIQSYVDMRNFTLTIDFYGTSDGRRAEIIDHKVWDIVGAPPPLYQDDPTLPAGVVKQVDFAAGGAKASFKYKVYNADGSLKEEQTFYSSFRPWQAVYLRGTGPN